MGAAMAMCQPLESHKDRFCGVCGLISWDQSVGIELLKQDHRKLCCCHKSWRGWPRDAFWSRPWYRGPWGLRQMMPRIWCWDPSQWDANCSRGSLLHVRCQVQRALHMWSVVAQLGAGRRVWWEGLVGSKAQRMSRSHPLLEGSVASLGAGLFYLLSLGGGVSEEAALLRARQGWRTDGKTAGLLSPRAALGCVPPSGPQCPPTLAFISWCSVLSV